MVKSELLHGYSAHNADGMDELHRKRARHDVSLSVSLRPLPDCRGPQIVQQLHFGPHGGGGRPACGRGAN